jgi:hypothetical protein
MLIQRKRNAMMTNLPIRPHLPQLRQISSNPGLDLHRFLAQEAKAARDERYLRSARILAAQARQALEAYRASRNR